MTFNSIELSNFRSYAKRSFDFSPKLNLIIGPNGAGKTNLLEALFVLASTRSFRTAQAGEMIRHGQDWLRLRVKTEKLKVDFQYRLGETKQMQSGGQAVTALEHVGKIPIVLFEPGMLAIIKGPPQWRRQYLNMILASLNRDYFKALVRYRRALKQRNNLLHYHSLAQLRREIFVWDLKLAEFAATIHRERQQLINFFNLELSRFFSQLSGRDTNVTIKYRSISESKDYASSLVEQLNHNLSRDMALGFTAVGPHREDMTVLLDGEAAAKTASRGETRTLIMAFKLAERAFTESKTATKPILLLDDVLSELDLSHRQHLIQTLDSYQTIITTTDKPKNLSHTANIIKLQ